ncbi:Scr1 family TA system antitoxin-like transcriptional regulator [Streptomyces sp. FXJ1.4098]|nr:Scr1 family TA system antitoxin-like transcriptional regulator [Streptomyces sp. FXJ1.4098]
MPGLFQTEPYARAVFVSRQPLFDDETVETRVAARLARPEILTRWPVPTVSAVIQESVLRHPFVVAGPCSVVSWNTCSTLRGCVTSKCRSRRWPVKSTQEWAAPSRSSPRRAYRPQVGYLEVQHISQSASSRRNMAASARRHSDHVSPCS